MAINITIKDHTDDVLRALESQIEAGLEGVGIQCEGHAQDTLTEKLPRPGSWSGSTGALRGSINHQVDIGEKAVYVGTNNNYAKYNELGTGAFADGGGRAGFWVYVPGGGKSGTNTGKVYSEAEARRIVAILKSKGLDAHMTMGMKPLHFLRDAASKHIAEYKKILEQALRG